MTDRSYDRAYRADDDDRTAPRSDSDPLAELARLIGQTDPFGAAAPRAAQPQAPVPQSAGAHSRTTDFRMSRPVPPVSDDLDDAPPTQPSWLQRRREAPREAAAPVEPDFSRPPSFVKAAAPLVDQQPDMRAYNPGPMDFGQTAAPANYQPAPIAPPHFEQPALDLREPAFDPRSFEPQAYDQRGAAPASLEPGRYDEALFGELPPEPQPGYYTDQQYGYDDGYADEAPAMKPRRNGMMTVVAILALAVVGTGGAFAYRTFAGGHRSGEPPVIKADTSPTKVPGPAADGKPIQDRLANNGAEALVSREEKPADPSQSPNGPRVVLPQLNQNPNPPGVASTSPSAKPVFPPPQTTASADEPRRIKTFSIHPDQADPSAEPVGRTPPATRAASRAPAAAPVAATPPAQAAAPQARRPARGVEDANASAPMSLAPDAADAPARAANQRVASLPPAESAGGGNYLVQVSSQISESDARSSYRALQGKFPSVLGSRSPVIKRADVGGKTVYRAMVGPFSGPAEAQQFCGSLKSAGGQCFVQRN